MSIAKHEMEVAEQRREVAIGILLKVGALEQCSTHEWIHFDGEGLLEDAYRLSNKRYTDQQQNYDHEMELFDSRRELTDAIKEAYEELWLLDVCLICAKD